MKSVWKAPATAKGTANRACARQKFMASREDLRLKHVQTMLKNHQLWGFPGTILHTILHIYVSDLIPPLRSVFSDKKAALIRRKMGAALWNQTIHYFFLVVSPIAT
jgi:hypothetical protein